MDISSIGNDYVTQADYALNQQASSASGFELALQAAAESGDEEELRNACKEFESYFLSIMFKEMRKTVTAWTATPKSSAEQVFQSMFDEKVAEDAASSGGIGLADFMFRQMSAANNAINIKSLYEE